MLARLRTGARKAGAQPGKLQKEAGMKVHSERQESTGRTVQATGTVAAGASGQSKECGAASAQAGNGNQDYGEAEAIFRLSYFS
jgi:hypothetical protein